MGAVFWRRGLSRAATLFFEFAPFGASNPGTIALVLTFMAPTFSFDLYDKRVIYSVGP